MTTVKNKSKVKTTKSGSKSSGADNQSRNDDKMVDKSQDRRRIAPRFIPLDRMIELYNRGLTITEIANVLQCDKANVSRRLQPYKDVYEKVNDFVATKTQMYNEIIREITLSISHDDYKKASLQQKVTAIGILEDKIAQLEGRNNIKIEIEHKLVNALQSARDVQAWSVNSRRKELFSAKMLEHEARMLSKYGEKVIDIEPETEENNVKGAE